MKKIFPDTDGQECDQLYNVVDDLQREINRLEEMPKGILRRNQIPALKEALFAEERLISRKFHEARDHALLALMIDPLCIDSYRILYTILNDITDGDTALCGIREVINFARIYNNSFFDKSRELTGYSCLQLRPYVRLLLLYSDIGRQMGRIDLTTHTDEELLRIDPYDNMNTRYMLLADYIKIIGRIDRGEPTPVVRTVDHLTQLLNAKKPDNNLLFSPPDDSSSNVLERLVQWARIFVAFIKNEDWKTPAKKELKESALLLNVLVKFTLHENEEKRLSSGCKCRNCTASKLAIYAFIDCPHFMILMRRLYRKQSSIKFNVFARKKAPHCAFELTEESRKIAASKVEFYMSEAKHFGAENPKEAINYYSLARFYLIKSNIQKRWYTNSPSIVVSKRAYCAYLANKIELFRIDARFALMMNPTNPANYRFLDEIAEFFGAQYIAEQIRGITKKINKDTNKQQFKIYAKMCIALLSMRALFEARLNRFTTNLFDELMEIGIEDMYTPVSSPKDKIELLPWITEDDLEKEVAY